MFMPYVDREPAHEFQRSQLQELAKLSYSDLEKYPPRTEIPSPPGLESFNFALEVFPDDSGGLEVSLFHYWIPENPGRTIGGFDVTIGEFKSCEWFNISPKGRIVWPDFEHDPLD